MTRNPSDDRLAYKSFYRRNLPHIQPLNTALFLTFRLADSLPREVLARMAGERFLLEKALKNDPAESHSRFRKLARRHFAMLESWLDKAAVGPTWLKNNRVAEVVAEAQHFRDGKKYRLDAYSIMPNHVHSVFAPLAQHHTPQSPFIDHAFAETLYGAACQPNTDSLRRFLGARELRSLPPKSSRAEADNQVRL